MIFNEWLKEQNHRNDRVGNLARSGLEVGEAKGLPKFLSKRKASEEEYANLNTAWNEFVVLFVETEELTNV